MNNYIYKYLIIQLHKHKMSSPVYVLQFVGPSALTLAPVSLHLLSWQSGQSSHRPLK